MLNAFYHANGIIHRIFCDTKTHHLKFQKFENTKCGIPVGPGARPEKMCPMVTYYPSASVQVACPGIGTGTPTVFTPPSGGIGTNSPKIWGGSGDSVFPEFGNFSKGEVKMTAKYAVAAPDIHPYAVCILRSSKNCYWIDHMSFRSKKAAIAALEALGCHRFEILDERKTR